MGELDAIMLRQFRARPGDEGVDALIAGPGVEKHLLAARSGLDVAPGSRWRAGRAGRDRRRRGAIASDQRQGEPNPQQRAPHRHLFQRHARWLIGVRACVKTRALVLAAKAELQKINAVHLF